MEEFEKRLTKLNEDGTYDSFLTAEEDQRFILNTERKLAFRDGAKQGKEENQLEIAGNMLKKGMEMSLIQELTGLSLEQINALKTQVTED